MPDPIAGAAAAHERARAEAALLAREAELAGTGTAAARLWISVADVRLTRAGDPEGALTALEAARLADPSSPAALAALRRLATRLGRWPLAAEALAAERKVSAGPEKTARTLELAEILADRLGRTDDALALYEEILDADPTDPRALARAVPLWTKAAAWTELVEAMTTAAETVRALDAKRAAVLFYEAGEVWRWRMHALDKASASYERAIEVDAEAAAAVKALAEVASELRDWRRLARALELEAGLATRGEIAAAALTKLGSLREEALGDLEGAEAAWRAALAKDPAHRPALAALARAAGRRGDDALLAEIREKELLQATDVRLAVALSLSLGEIYEQRLHDPGRAATQYQRVLAVTAQEAPAFRALGRLMAATSQWDMLVRLYEREAAETTDDVYRLHCLFKIAEIQEEKGGDDRKAQEAYWRVLEAAPTYLPALRALGRIFQRREDWSSLVALYLREADATEDLAHWLDILARTALVQEEKLAALDAAAKTWDRVLARLPEYLPALRALARLHYRRADWTALVQINLREAALARDPQLCASLLHKTGEIYEERLDAADDAIRCYRSSLDHVPNFLPAMRSLGRLAARRGAWQEVVETELMEAELVKDVRRAASLLASAAEHQERRIGDAGAAMKTYERVLEKVPGYLPAVAGLARLYRAAGRWNDLIRVLESAVPSVVRDPGGAAALSAEIAAIEGHRLGNDAAAQARITAARHMLPDDPHVRRELEEYLAKAGGWNDLAGAYAETAAASPEGALRAGLQVRVADLAWRGGAGGDPVRAAAAYRAALAAEPGNRAAANGLEDVAIATSDAKLRVEALTALSVAARTAGERRAILTELARLHEEAGDVASAEGCWSAVAQIEPDVESWEALARAARRAGRSLAAADSLGKAIAQAADPAEKERLSIELANDLAEGGQLEQAAAALVPVSQAAPEPTAALLALERVYRALATHPEAGTEALGKLADVLRRLASLTRDPARRTQLTLEAASTLATGLGRGDEGARLLEEVAGSEPAGSAAQRDALQRLAAVYAAAGDRMREAATLERLADGAPAAQRAEWLTRAGTVLAGLDDDRAITCWERAVAADANASAALDALLLVYRAREAWQPLLATWNRVIQATRDPKVAAKGYYEKGMLLLEQMRLPDKAEQHFQRSLAALPTFGPALERLAAFHRERKEHAAERELLAQLAAQDAPPEARAVTYVALARAARDAGDAAGALAAVREASALDPTNAEAWDLMLALQGAGADPAERVRALEKGIEIAGASGDEARRVRLRLQLARVLDERGDEAGALAQAGAAVKAAPADADARLVVATLLAKKKESRAAAIDAHHAVLRLDPLRAESLAWLARTFEEAGQHDRLLCLSAVVALGGVEGTDAAIFYREQMPRAPREARASLSFEDRLQLLAAPGARGKLGELLARLDGAAFRGGPADLAPLGPTEPVALGHALFPALDAVRKLLGVPDAKAVFARSQNEPAWVAPGDPPVLVLGAPLLPLGEGPRRFLIARAAFRLSMGWYPAGRSAADVRQDLLLAAAALEVAPPPKDVDQRRMRGVVKAIPRKARKEILELLPAFLAKPESFDTEAFLAASDRSADRAGLLACVDAGDALTALALVEPLAGITGAADEPRAQAAARTAIGRELLVFAASEDLAILRKRAGLTIL